MSIFNGYRVNFAGGFYTNVCTANNDDVLHAATDPLNGMIMQPYDKMADDDLIEMFKQQPAAGGPINSGWNYFGDHETRFTNAMVTSYGHPGAITDKGNPVGAAVYILGSGGNGAPVMVDVDPSGGGVATQIFLGGLRLGDGDNGVAILWDTVCYTYFVGPRFTGSTPAVSGFRSYATLFQFTIPASALPAKGETAFEPLLEAARAAQGLVVRFSPFEVAYALDSNSLAQAFRQGQAPKNPALGYLVGTIGIWRVDELSTSPAGRVLAPSGAYSDVLANVDPSNGILSLDLVSAVPKASPRGTITDVSTIGRNLDIGQLHVSCPGVSSPLPSITLDPVNYWKFGGLVDLGVGKAVARQLVGQPLTLSAPKVNVIWVEEPYRVESDQRGLYLGNPAESLAMRVKVTEYGGPPTAPVTLQLTTESSSFPPQVPFWPDPKNLVFMVAGENVQTVNVGAGKSIAEFTVATNGKAGLSQLDVTAVGPLGKSSEGSFQSVFRVFPLDDFSNVIKAGNIQWQFVYDNVLRYYYVIFPAMSQRIPLNRPEILTLPSVVEQIKARMDDRIFGTTGYMPITRALSPGKKKLLFAFFDEAAKPKATSIAGQEVEEGPKQKPSF